MFLFISTPNCIANSVKYHEYAINNVNDLIDLSHQVFMTSITN